MYKQTTSIVAMVLMANFTFAPPGYAQEQRKPPNIVVILSDDMGFSDIGCYGGEISTPHLDKLAANGLRYTQCYNCARCCPTRASMLTGVYPHQAGVGHMMDDHGKDKPGYRGNLNTSCRTLPELLKSAGYKSYAAGKWHVTRNVDKDGPKNNWPLQRGFDRFYGTIHGAGSFYDPTSLVRDNTMISPFADPDYQPKQYYYTDAISHHAVKYIRDNSKLENQPPFLLYVAYTAAHWPMHALPEDIKKYQGKYDRGYDEIRNARFEKAVKLGLVDAKQGMCPQSGDWSKVDNKKWEAACMEVYAAMVDRMDQGIGRIIGELNDTGQLDNTVIMYMQDNGGCAEPMGRSGNKEHPNIEAPLKPTLPPMKPEQLMPPGSVPKQTRDGFPVRMGNKVMPGGADTYIAYGQAWANVSNTPFREYKHFVHEGGISTPLIVHWPKGIQGKGGIRQQACHVIDVAATCVDLARVQVPAKVNDVPQLPLEGVSLLPTFDDKPVDRELFWEHDGNRAVRSANWKLVAKGADSKWELYDISQDRIESKNLAPQFPERVVELATKWETWATRAKVIPWIWKPDYKPMK